MALSCWNYGTPTVPIVLDLSCKNRGNPTSSISSIIDVCVTEITEQPHTYTSVLRLTDPYHGPHKYLDNELSHDFLNDGQFEQGSTINFPDFVWRVGGSPGTGALDFDLVFKPVLLKRTFGTLNRRSPSVNTKSHTTQCIFLYTRACFIGTSETTIHFTHLVSHKFF